MRGAGAPLDHARVAMLLVHGRGATAESILTLTESLGRAEVAYLAPQAPGSTWYPLSFLAPLAANEPALGHALRTVGEGVAEIARAGIPAERTVLLGFSQGACLALEFAARNARRYGGVVAFSGGLLGTAEAPEATPPNDKRFDYGGDLAGTPVFLGCSDVDSHIPVERVRRSAHVLRDLGGDVTERIYPGMGHTVNDDEIAFVRGLLDDLLGGR